MCAFNYNSAYSHSHPVQNEGQGSKHKYEYSYTYTASPTPHHHHHCHCAAGKAHHYSLRTVIAINHACPLHQNLPTELVWGLDIINVSANCQVIFT